MKHISAPTNFHIDKKEGKKGKKGTVSRSILTNRAETVSRRWTAPCRCQELFLDLSTVLPPLSILAYKLFIAQLVFKKTTPGTEALSPVSSASHIQVVFFLPAPGEAGGTASRLGLRGCSPGEPSCAQGEPGWGAGGTSSLGKAGHGGYQTEPGVGNTCASGFLPSSFSVGRNAKVFKKAERRLESVLVPAFSESAVRKDLRSLLSPYPTSLAPPHVGPCQETAPPCPARQPHNQLLPQPGLSGLRSSCPTGRLMEPVG